MTSRDDIMIEITPQVLLKAYSCGIFPMAESADDPALYWIEPQHRGILPLDSVHVPRRLARTLRTTPLEVASIATSTASSRAAPPRARGAARPGSTSASARFTATCSTSAIAIPSRLGTAASSAASMAWRSAAPSSARACSPTSATPPRSRSFISRARLAHGGFTLLDTQFVTDHLRQFGTVEVDRDEFHRRLDAALSVKADFLRLDPAAPPEQVLEILDRAHTGPAS